MSTRLDLIRETITYEGSTAGDNSYTVPYIGNLEKLVIIKPHSGSAAFTVTLPTIGLCVGSTVFVKFGNAVAIDLTVDAGTNTIDDGATTTYTLNINYDMMGFTWDGTEWQTHSYKSTITNESVSLLAAGGLQFTGDALGIKLDTNSGLELSATGLIIDLDASSGLALAAGGISIDDDGVTTVKILDANVTTAKLDAAAVTGPKLDLSSLKVLSAAGVNSGGGDAPVTVTGVADTDRLIAVFGAPTAGGAMVHKVVGTDFAADPPAADTITQLLAAGDLSASTFIFMLLPASA